MKLNFTKMQGAGNDYIYIDCRAAGLPPDAAAAMRMFNADGSEGVMCGNGVRCAAEFLYTHGVRRDCIRIDTPSAGQRVLHRVGDGLWQVEMGRFTAAPDAVGAVGLGGGPLLDVPLCAGGRAWRVHCVAVGARQRGHAGLRDRGLRRGRGGGADRPLSARRAHFSTAAGRHAGGVCAAGRHRAFDRRRRSNI